MILWGVKKVRKWYAESCANEGIKVRKRYIEVRKWKALTHIKSKRTTLQMRLDVAYQKLWTNV